MFPMNDPLLLIPSMSHATKHVGIGVTANHTNEQPYLLARRFSTLDHLTHGRVSWNVVTGFQDSAARAMGMQTNLAHDDRYDLADEYMEVVYKLWEGSWEDGAVVRDVENRVFARGDMVHEVRHEGKHFNLRGVHMCEPSPQRTPVIYQAGGSARGRAFASAGGDLGAGSAAADSGPPLPPAPSPAKPSSSPGSNSNPAPTATA
jgi:alkanesulfonate monooxygenase SsuD/methylene tetrahydromethanopterin reductase-like flavin-dependent oxidoreductase (luciferase family)